MSDAAKIWIGHLKRNNFDNNKFTEEHTNWQHLNACSHLNNVYITYSLYTFALCDSNFSAQLTSILQII